MVEHFSVEFGDRSCIGFWDIMLEKQTVKQTNKQSNKQTHKRRWKPYLRDYIWRG